jgi:3-isopropylmalate/(R)-2-methylmalate dehydratase small subunit
VTPFLQMRGLAVGMPEANIDTDVIMPKVFLKGIDREGLARGLFHDLRFDADGGARPAFILNHAATQDASILVVGPNFGCGSSREHAVWGMQQFGFRIVIGTTFGGIFADNSANNGLLLVSLESDVLAPLLAYVCRTPQIIAVDLVSQSIEYESRRISFSVEPERRRMLMSGLDRIGDTLTRSAEIRRFETGHFTAYPWLKDGEKR